MDHSLKPTCDFMVSQATWVIELHGKFTFFNIDMRHGDLPSSPPGVEVVTFCSPRLSYLLTLRDALYVLTQRAVCALRVRGDSVIWGLRGLEIIRGGFRGDAGAKYNFFFYLKVKANCVDFKINTPPH